MINDEQGKDLTGESTLQSTIEKTEALVLRIIPYSNTSHIVVWLTPKSGRIATIIKGACRSRSPFIGQYDLFQTCELIYYHRERPGPYIVRECSSIKPRHSFRSDWAAAACASYVCDIANRLCLDGLPHPRLYELLDSSLDYLCSGKAEKQFLSWFDMALSEIMGLSPQLSKCVVCDRSADDNTLPVFSCAKGGLICRECVSARSIRTEKIGRDVLAILRSWQRKTSPESARNTRCTPDQTMACFSLIGDFLKYHIDTVPESRDIAGRIFDYNR